MEYMPRQIRRTMALTPLRRPSWVLSLYLEGHLHTYADGEACYSGMHYTVPGNCSSPDVSIKLNAVALCWD